MRDLAIAFSHTITAITAKQVIASINLNWVKLFGVIAHCGKDQTMKCVDCELHDCVVGTHFCNYKGKSGKRKPRRISEEDAYKDVPCEYVEEVKGADNEKL